MGFFIYFASRNLGNMISLEQLYKIYLENPLISTDSRKISPGCLFFALKGENFNGNRFAGSAIGMGAAFSIIDEPVEGNQEQYLRVENVLETLQKLALLHRKRSSFRVIAITGTNGKTTTKELIRCVMSQKYDTVATSGNLNNHIGVPLTLLSCGKATEFAIVELGANHPGEIEFLCNISLPEFGLITNIGRAHLEGFGGFDGVVKTKTELYRFLRLNGGTSFLNTDNVLLVENCEGLDTYKYGRSPEADVKGTLISSDPSVEADIHLEGASVRIRSHLFGDYNFENILAAVAIGEYFKVEPEQIRAAIESYVPGNNRSQVVKKGSNTLIMDAYNANPSSMEAAIRNFASSGFASKIIILGDMLELGRETDAEHQKILDLLEEKKLPRVYLVGPVFTRLSTKREWICFEDSELAAIWFSHHKPENATILVKGSRGIKLERITEVL
jgi:UDP-N-acetylmuramoyl-tripeptide--D-alanyl-D-alanine ligase